MAEGKSVQYTRRPFTPEPCQSAMYASTGFLKSSTTWRSVVSRATVSRWLGGTTPAKVSASRAQVPSVNLYSKAVPGGSVSDAVRAVPVPWSASPSGRHSPRAGRLPARYTVSTLAGTVTWSVTVQQGAAWAWPGRAPIPRVRRARKRDRVRMGMRERGPGRPQPSSGWGRDNSTASQIAPTVMATSLTLKM